MKVKVQASRSYQDPLDPAKIVRTDNQRLSDPAYQEVAEKMVIACTDTVFTIKGDKAIYLGKRNIYPMCGVWCFGGRIFFNDATLQDSIARCMLLETGIKIDPTRFESLSPVHFYSWVKVAQGDFGGRNLGFSFKLEVTEEELKTIAQGLSPTEYDREFGIQRFDKKRLIEENVHQAMIDIFDDIFGT